jgi:hypothetical protein
MEKLKVECVRVQSPASLHEQITHLGGSHADGSRWRLTQREAIRAIHTRQHTFVLPFASAPLAELEIIIRQGDMGHEYLTTREDGETQNRLISLPTCL